MEKIIEQLKERNVDFEQLNENVIKKDNVIIELIRFDGSDESHGFLKRKQKEYSLLGLKPIFIYENEYLNKFDIVLNKVLYILKVKTDKIKIRASKCDIKQIHASKSDFLIQNHIQGKTSTVISIGAFYNDEQVAIMCFDNNRNMAGGNKNKENYELNRFCVKNDVIINGIATRMLNFFIENFNVDEIISFADKRWTLSSDNNLYTKLGFTIEKYTKINYLYYFDTNRVYAKYSFGKQKFKKNYPDIYDEKKTEDELRKLIGLKRVFDLGKYKYILKVGEITKTNNKFSIYMIRNKVNGKVYIGQTVRNISRRFSEHMKKPINNHLNNAYNKYGKENFEFIVLETCDTLEELNKKEKYYIELYDSMNRDKGYNLTSGGDKTKVSDETRKKIGESHKGRKQSEEWINKRIKRGKEHHGYGVPKTEEYKKKLSEATKGENSYWFGKKRPNLKTKYTRQETDGKKVVEYRYSTNEIINVYPSIREASRETGKTFGTINNHCKNLVKKHISDIRFRYATDEEKEKYFPKKSS
jgi:group I intron endonuclease